MHRQVVFRNTSVLYKSESSRQPSFEGIMRMFSVVILRCSFSSRLIRHRSPATAHLPQYRARNSAFPPSTVGKENTKTCGRAQGAHLTQGNGCGTRAGVLVYLGKFSAGECVTSFIVTEKEHLVHSPGKFEGHQARYCQKECKTADMKFQLFFPAVNLILTLTQETRCLL